MEYYSLTDIKKKNRSDVFHYIYKNPGISKQGIATALGISLPTVTLHLTALMEEGLIEKCGQLRSSIGRKAAAYSVVATARISVGIEILSNVVYIVGINLYGKKEAKDRLKINFEKSEAYFEALKDFVYSFMEKYQFSWEQVPGIGIGIQGLTSQDGRTVTYGKILDCTGLSVSIFEKYFPVPCRFIHDPECAANSELWENPEIRDCIYLSLGRHLGGAIILDGKLQQGISGKSGTFEHMTLIPGGKPCYCGKQGCAESYCSGKTLLPDTDMELEDFFALKATGDSQCEERWNEYLYHLALLIGNLHMVMENVVILGGHITPFFTEEDINNLRQLVFEMSAFHDPADYIVPGKCRNDAVPIGAALPFIIEFFQSLSEDVE